MILHRKTKLTGRITGAQRARIRSATEGSGNVASRLWDVRDTRRIQHEKKNLYSATVTGVLTATAGLGQPSRHPRERADLGSAPQRKSNSCSRTASFGGRRP